LRSLIKRARIVDPASEKDFLGDLYFSEGKLTAIGEDLFHMAAQADEIFDANGLIAAPGLVDMHVHLRDPGLTHKEDVFTGSKAAARGGVTTLVAMPNTKPVIDNPERLSYVKNKAMQCNLVNVLQAGAITQGMKGEELSDIEGMVQAGAPAISEDGKSVMNAQIYKEAMQIAARMNIPVLAHCEDIHMVNGGCMNEDTNSEKFGLPGICNAVEDTIVARDILIAKDTGCHLHLCHCSTKDSEVMLRLAKEEGISVSGEVCPHHFTLTSDDIVEGDTNYKMNPPLRTKEDRQALLEGLKNDVFDVISTDHAPHTMVEKGVSMKSAPFGIVGLETSVSLTITELVDKGWITPMQMAEKMSYNPAKILHLANKGSLKPGKDADVVVIDPKESYVIDVKDFVSKGKNTPFQGKKVNGKVKVTICGGRVVYEDK
jgi:dihydroorotase